MEPVTQEMVDLLVDKEIQKQVIAQHKGIDMDSIRIAWPFKTDEEREKIAKWFKKEKRKYKEKESQEHIKKYGKAFL